MEKLTVAEVAQRVGKTSAAIYMAVQKGWIEAEYKYGIWLITESALASYNPRRRGRPETNRQIRTDISQSAVARELGVSRQRVNQIVRKKSHNARVVLWQAVKAGKVIKPNTCERCCLAQTLEAHHPDYSQPLKVQWLCSSCHSLIHPHHNNIHGNGPSGRPRKGEK